MSGVYEERGGKCRRHKRHSIQYIVDSIDKLLLFHRRTQRVFAALIKHENI